MEHPDITRCNATGHPDGKGPKLWIGTFTLIGHAMVDITTEDDVHDEEGAMAMAFERINEGDAEADWEVESVERESPDADH